MDGKDFFIKVVASLGGLVVAFFLLGHLYTLVLELQDYGLRYLYPALALAVSVVVLGSIACTFNRRSLILYYMQRGTSSWQDFQLPRNIWMGWQALKVIAVGYFLRNEFFGFSLISMFLGNPVPGEMVFILFGPVLTALVIRFMIGIAEEVPSLGTDRTLVKIVMLLSLLLGLFSLRSVSSIQALKVAMCVGVFVGGGALLLMKKENLLPFLVVVLCGVFIVGIMYDVIVGYPMEDRTMWYAGLENATIVQLNNTAPDPLEIDAIVEGVDKVPLFDEKVAAGAVSGLSMDPSETLDTPQFWFYEANGTQRWLIAHVIAKTGFISTDWESTHIRHATSSGIFEIEPIKGDVEENQQFPKKDFYYGPNEGFENWAFVGVDKSAGVRKTGVDVMLFDYRLIDFLPGRIVRNRVVRARVEKLFPYLAVGEPFLVTDGGRIFYTMGLIANLPTTWEAGARVPFTREIGRATVDVESGEVRLYTLGGNGILGIMERFYSFEPMPLWLGGQDKYPVELVKKQLQAIQYYVPAKIAPDELLNPTYLMTSDGPRLVMLLKQAAVKGMIGYMNFGCGSRYGDMRVFLFKEPLLMPDDVGEKLRGSSLRIPQEGLDLGSYMKTNRPRMSDPVFYPSGGETFYFVPIYVKEESRTIMRYVAALNTRNNKIGVGATAREAVAMIYKE